MYCKHFISAGLLLAAIAFNTVPAMASVQTTATATSPSWIASILGPLGLLWEEGIYY